MTLHAIKDELEHSIEQLRWVIEELGEDIELAKFESERGGDSTPGLVVHEERERLSKCIRELRSNKFYGEDK